MRLRQRVEEAARRAGFRSLRALAKAVGCSPPWMSGVVNGEHPGDELIQKIADKTKVSVHWIRDGKTFDAPPWALDLEDNQIPALVQARQLILGRFGRTPTEQLRKLLERDPELAAEAVRVAEDQRRGIPGSEALMPSPVPLRDDADLGDLMQVVAMASRNLVNLREVALAKAQQALVDQVNRQPPPAQPRSRVEELVERRKREIAPTPVAST